MQTIMNGMMGGYITSATLTVQPQLPVYSISGSLPSALKIVDIRDASGRSLDGPVPYETLKYLSFDWWRETGPEPRSYSIVGKDLLIIRPQLIMAATVTVVYIAVTNPLNVDSDTFQVPNEDVMGPIEDGVELLLTMKGRDLDTCKSIFERIQKGIIETEKKTR